MTPTWLSTLAVTVDGQSTTYYLTGDRDWSTSEGGSGTVGQFPVAGALAMTLGSAVTAISAPGGALRTLSVTGSDGRVAAYSLPTASLLKIRAMALNAAGDSTGAYDAELRVGRITAFTFTYH